MTDFADFDPVAFLQAQQTEVNEKRELLPVGGGPGPNGYYLAIIGDMDPAKVNKTGIIGKGDRTGEPWWQVNVPLEVEVPPEIQASKGLPAKMRFTDGVFMDLLPGGKGIDNSKGRNAGQKKYRDALNKNNPGDTWSWTMASGQPVYVAIKHEVNQQTGDLRDTVGGVFRFK